MRSFVPVSPNILIADDHPITRSGVRYILRTYFPGVRTYEADKAETIFSLCKENDMDVLILDLNMPDSDPQGLVQTLLTLYPKLNILIFTMNKEAIFGPLYYKLGVKGFVHKLNGEEEIVKAVEVALSGDIYIHRKMKEFYASMQEHQSPYDILTKKEKEVLRHLINGTSTAEIGRIMNIGAATISTHKGNIQEKLRIRNVLDLKLFTELYPLI